MKQPMTQWGVGPKFTVVALIMASLVFTIHYVWLAHLKIPLPRTLTLILGIVLVIIGIPVFLVPGLTIGRSFEQGELATKGVYSYIRHPIYGSWIVFFIPGIVFLLNSLIGLLIPIFMYAVFKIFIVEEERYLGEKFGQKYIEYKKNVGSIFPKFKSIF
jgi:protein-S-isoprenylcysteine O-methyltransferase Ste14